MKIKNILRQITPFRISAAACIIVAGIHQYNGCYPLMVLMLLLSLLPILVEMERTRAEKHIKSARKTAEGLLRDYADLIKEYKKLSMDYDDLLAEYKKVKEKTEQPTNNTTQE